MEIRYGNGGWVRVDQDDWPGSLFLRLERDVNSVWRTRDFYWHGDWRQIVGADLRELDLSRVEKVVLGNADVLEFRESTPGPDVHLLAQSYATTFGAGNYAERHCGSCSAPLKGATPREKELWTGDWVALSWFAQWKDRIHRPREPKDREVPRTPGDVPRLQRPTDGLTTAFLEHVRDAYLQAVADGKPPAVELAKQVGNDTSPRTIHKWVAVARERGVMARAGRRRGDGQH